MLRELAVLRHVGVCLVQTVPQATACALVPWSHLARQAQQHKGELSSLAQHEPCANALRPATQTNTHTIQQVSLLGAALPLLHPQIKTANSL
jgi:hypothetical protein